MAIIISMMVKTCKDVCAFRLILMPKIFMMIKTWISVDLIFLCVVLYSKWSKLFCAYFFVARFFYITVIAELFIFQIAESTADWNSPKTSQNISTSPYFSISKCNIFIVHCRDLTRKFWYFWGCRVHQPIESNSGIEGQLSANV